MGFLSCGEKGNEIPEVIGRKDLERGFYRWLVVVVKIGRGLRDILEVIWGKGRTYPPPKAYNLQVPTSPQSSKASWRLSG